MAKINWKGSAMLAPVPAVLITCKDGEKENVMTVAWTGIINTHPPKTYISVRESRYSYNIIKNSGEFAINLTTTSLAYATDFCGVRTGAKIDKFEHCKLTKTAASVINAPIIEECPLSLECKVTDVVKLGTHDMFIADIVAVDVDEKLIDESGRLALERADLLAYVHGQYFGLGKKYGKFGYSVEKKKKKRPHS